MPAALLVRANDAAAMLERRRPVMQAWADHVTGTGAEVVKFNGKGR